MNTKLNLMPFCSTDTNRKNIQKPWSLNGFTYATDGKILVQIEGSHADPNEGAPKLSLDGGFRFNHSEMQDWIELPAVIDPPKTSDCTTCKGTGSASECKECQGDGNVECDYGHDHECPKCDGIGSTPSKDGKTCSDCNSGKVELFTSMQVGGQFINVRYLATLKGLDGVKINTTRRGSSHMIPFKFNGGLGYVMPCRKQ